MRRGLPMVAAFDLLSCLLLVFVIHSLVERPRPTPPRIETEGVYAIASEWPRGLDDDVDLYIQDPDGNVCYFGAQSIGLMHLEHDDLGSLGDVQGETELLRNHERTILRGVLAGEYIVGVHLYRRGSRSPARIPVTISLYRLRGVDRRLLLAHVSLEEDGDEATAFRFTLDSRGEFAGHSLLPKRLVGVEPQS